MQQVLHSMSGKATLTKRVRSKSRKGAMIERPSAGKYYRAGAREGCLVQYVKPSGKKAWHVLALRSDRIPYWRVLPSRPPTSSACLVRGSRVSRVSRRGRGRGRSRG